MHFRQQLKNPQSDLKNHTHQILLFSVEHIYVSTVKHGAMRVVQHDGVGHEAQDHDERLDADTDLKEQEAGLKGQHAAQRVYLDWIYHSNVPRR